MQFPVKVDELIDGLTLWVVSLYKYIRPGRNRTSCGRSYAYDDVMRTSLWDIHTASNSAYIQEICLYPAHASENIPTPMYEYDGLIAYCCGIHCYTWDGENRMITASNSSMTASYNYDYMGRRFQKSVVTNSVTTTSTFIYDGWNLVSEVKVGAGVPGGTNITQFIWGLDLSQSLQGAGGIVGLLCVIEKGTPYYPCADGNGNITDYLDTNGVVVAHREFDPFGNTIVASRDKVNDFRFWFSSKYLDAETGLYYYGYRAYNSAIGRWISRE